MRIVLLVICCIHCLLCDVLGSGIIGNNRQGVLNYLQGEGIKINQIQSSLASRLRSKGISIGDKPGTIRRLQEEAKKKLHIAISTKENPLDCRMSLCTVAEGRKCMITLIIMNCF